MSSRFGVFVLTHRRADQVKTVKTLRRAGYTGPVHLLVSDDDPQLARYLELYGGMVEVFRKADYRGRFDMMDNLPDMATVTFARNASYDVAERLGYGVFAQLDDDYRDVRWLFDSRNQPVGRLTWVKSLDAVMEAAVEFYLSAPVDVLAFAQTGDYLIGGKTWPGGCRRKAMNWMFCSPSRRVVFRGRLNDDVNTYLGEGAVGRLFLTVQNVACLQKETQSQPGGLSDTYRRLGTYTKSFSSVMLRPSCVRVAPIGHVSLRLHHRISWKHAVPMILSDRCRKHAEPNVEER